MELHPSRTNFKKLISFINTALNLARPANREELKPRDHRPEQRQINSLKLRFHKPFKSTTMKMILTFITLSTTAVCKSRVVEYFCEAKPQKRDLQTVQPRSGVLLRLVMDIEFHFL
jgi:hypothetical protein